MLSIPNTELAWPAQFSNISTHYLQQYMEDEAHKKINEKNAHSKKLSDNADEIQNDHHTPNGVSTSITHHVESCITRSFIICTLCQV
jgi:hypothetical protein